MHKLLLILTILFAPFLTLAQKVNKKIESQVISEGHKLYRSEVASWYGTDLFLQNHPDLKDKAAGYFSYAFQDSVRCIFFSKGDAPTSLITFTFGKSLDINTAKTNATERAFTKLEADYYQIRRDALAEVNADTLFKTYNNTSLNLVPLIEGNRKKVYVLTGPQIGGVVILGNDYLITFDKNNKVLAKQKLHQNIIPIEHDTNGTGVEATMHSHLPATGDYMTPTDICTLLLYGEMSNWKQHFTISKNFVTIWDIDKRSAVTLTNKAWEKIMGQSAEARRD